MLASACLTPRAGKGCCIPSLPGTRSPSRPVLTGFVGCLLTTGDCPGYLFGDGLAGGGGYGLSVGAAAGLGYGLQTKSYMSALVTGMKSMAPASATLYALLAASSDLAVRQHLSCTKPRGGLLLALETRAGRMTIHTRAVTVP